MRLSSLWVPSPITTTAPGLISRSRAAAPSNKTRQLYKLRPLYRALQELNLHLSALSRAHAGARDPHTINHSPPRHSDPLLPLCGARRFSIYFHPARAARHRPFILSSFFFPPSSVAPAHTPMSGSQCIARRLVLSPSVNSWLAAERRPATSSATAAAASGRLSLKLQRGAPRREIKGNV